MDYKEIHKAAVERAKECLKDDSTIKDYVEYIFPELKESEDERIKFLIKSCVYASDITPEGREEIFAWLEKQGEKKPTDKVEPKFRVGDWITDGYLHCKITEILDDRYIIEYKFSKRSVILFEDENHYHLWTIADAKDGDVLVDENDNIGLYSGEKDDVYWHSCVYLGCDGFIHGGFGVRGYHKHNNTKPATEEQRDQLFQEMKEVGFKWNNEKKELEKIEVPSEDEMIRKGLLKAFGTIGKKDWGGLVVRDILDWLEKQGEKKSVDEVLKIRQELYQSGYNDGYKQGQEDIAIKKDLL